MTRKRAFRALDPEVPFRRRFVASVLAREVLRDVAELLHTNGIPVMPLKGVLFQLVLYPDPAERALTDIDILVPKHAFATAIEVLLQAGFAPRSAGRTMDQCALRAPCGMTVDLHYRLFGPGRCKLSTEAFFRRASRNDALLGVPLYIAHPHDTAAHLIGKLILDHRACERPSRLAELSRWIQHCEIDPIRFVRHLCSNGMSRAARYVFSQARDTSKDPFFSAALAVLPSDALGSVCAGAVSRGYLPAHLLNDSMLRGGASLTWYRVQCIRHAWLLKQRGVGGGYWSPFFATKGASRPATLPSHSAKLHPAQPGL